MAKNGVTRIFSDRAEAGSRLAEKLKKYADGRDLLVLALPRGGVPVAFEVATALSARSHLPGAKLGVRDTRLAFGAIAWACTALNRRIEARPSPAAVIEPSRPSKQSFAANNGPIAAYGHLPRVLRSNRHLSRRPGMERRCSPRFARSTRLSEPSWCRPVRVLEPGDLNPNGLVSDVTPSPFARRSLVQDFSRAPTTSPRPCSSRRPLSSSGHRPVALCHFDSFAALTSRSIPPPANDFERSPST